MGGVEEGLSAIPLTTTNPPAGALGSPIVTSRQIGGDWAMWRCGWVVESLQVRTGGSKHEIMGSAVPQCICLQDQDWEVPFYSDHSIAT